MSRHWRSGLGNSAGLRSCGREKPSRVFSEGLEPQFHEVQCDMGLVLRKTEKICTSLGNGARNPQEYSLVSGASCPEVS